MQKDVNKIHGLFGLKISVVVLAMFFAFSSDAKENSQEVFRIISHSVNFESPKAEICLTFNSSIATDDREAIAAKIRLKKDGKRIYVSPRDLSLTSYDLCVQQLDHQHKYNLSIGDMRDDKNRPLSNKSSLSFVVPKRKPFLSFKEDLSPRKLPRMEKNVDAKQNGFARVPQKLHAVNVTSVQLTLYRIAERKNLSAAWLQYEQVRLTPSESLYFANNKGTQVWQSEIVFGNSPNTEQSLDVTLPSGVVLPSGLYFLSAKPKKAASPSLLAGMWFVVSNLKIAATVDDGGVSVFVADTEKMRGAPEILLQLSDKEGQIISETKSDANGTALFSIASDKNSFVSSVVGSSKDGDVDIIDITNLRDHAFLPVQQDAFLGLDRDIYESGSIASVSILLRNENGVVQNFPKSSLKLLRPDQSFHSEIAVSEDKKGLEFLTMPLPVTNETGEWKIMWQQADGKILAQKYLKISAAKIWPRLAITANKGIIEDNETIIVTIKAADDKGKPLAERAGNIVASLDRLNVSTWNKYSFGTIDGDEDKTLVTKKFVTAMDGTAYVQIQIPSLKDDLSAHSVKLVAKLDNMAFSTLCLGCKENLSHAAVLNIPVKPQYVWVGIRPLSNYGVFTENKGTAFDVIAIDQSGKRQSIEDLYFNIYEEGRSFEWYPAEGHWEYNPLPSHRRIEGGLLSVNATGNNVIRLPVAAGQHVLEITDEFGGIMSQYSFDVVTQQSQAKNTQKKEPLEIVEQTLALDVDKENKLRVFLSKPAMVNVIMGDKNARLPAYKHMQEGENIIDLQAINGADKVDGKKWTQISVQAIFLDGDVALKKLVLPKRRMQQELTLDFSIPSPITSGTSLNFSAIVQKIAGKQPTFVSVIASPDVDREDNFNSSMVSSPVQTDRDGKAQLRVDLPEFSGSLKINLYAWNDNQFMQKEANVSARPAISITSIDEEGIKNFSVGDRRKFNVQITNNTGKEETYNYAFVLPEVITSNGATKGTMTLKKGQKRILSFDISSLNETRDELRLDIQGKNNFHATRLWPVIVKNGKRNPIAIKDYMLEPDKTINLSAKGAEKQKSSNAVSDGKSTVIVSAFPLHNLPNQLRSALISEPSSTKEIYVWLDAVNAWKQEIVALGFSSESGLRRLIKNRLQQLQRRQNDDGGFAADDESKISDIASTAYAIEVLQGFSPTSSESIAAGIAARWLRHKLENSWFDESERSIRATAFLALSINALNEKNASDRGHISALRYFADTSKDKELPPLAMAELSLALSLNNEEGLAKLWLHRANEEENKKTKTKSTEGLIDKWLLIRRFAENSLFETRGALVEFEKTIADVDSLNMQAASAYLSAAGETNKRTDSWHMDINGADKKIKGVHLLFLTDKNPSFALKNKTQSKLYILQTEPERL